MTRAEMIARAERHALKASEAANAGNNLGLAAVHASVAQALAAVVAVMPADAVSEQARPAALCAHGKEVGEWAQPGGPGVVVHVDTMKPCEWPPGHAAPYPPCADHGHRSYAAPVDEGGRVRVGLFHLKDDQPCRA